jgi:RND family efflux transporter MFP subunit
LKKLLKTNAIAKNELEQMETDAAVAKAEVNILKTRLSYSKIYAPFSGILTERLAEPYDVISAQTHVLTIIDRNSIVVNITPSEKIISQLTLQQVVSIQIDALGQQRYSGTITRIFPTVDSQTRLGTVEITLNKLPSDAKVGQFCRVTIELTSKPQLSIPYIALRRDNQGEYVFLLDVDNKVHRQSVQIGLRLADRVEITNGLTEEQVIITKGFLGLNPDMIVEPVHLENTH